MKVLKSSIVLNILLALMLIISIKTHNEHNKYSNVAKAANLFSKAISIEYDNIDEEDKNCTFSAYSVLEELCCEYDIDSDSLLNKYINF